MLIDTGKAQKLAGKDNIIAASMALSLGAMWIHHAERTGDVECKHFSCTRRDIFETALVYALCSDEELTPLQGWPHSKAAMLSEIEEMFS